MASTSQLSPRQPLADLTNDVLDSSNTPTRGKRRAESPSAGSKRARLSDAEQNIEDAEDAQMQDASAEPVRAPRRGRRLGALGMIQALRMGDPVAHRLFTLSTIRVLESFVSSNKSDIFKCQSLDAGSFLTPPYSCAYSHASKNGRASLLAVATEQGNVDLVNTVKRNDWDPEPSRTTLQIHTNGIFDVKWSSLDAFLATASGDRTIAITDPNSSTGTALYSLNGGHSSTVKCVSWDPTSSDLLVSGGRDGCIFLWDLRTRGQGGLDQDEEGGRWKPVMSIPYAHEATAGKPTKKGRTHLAPKSITSLAYVPFSSHEIISSGAADGILRKWDLRSTLTSPSKRSKKPASVQPVDSTLEDLTAVTYASESTGLTSTPTRRARGIISLAFGCGPTAGRIFALSNDSRVHTYNACGAAGMPLGVRQADQAYGHRHMATNSFYVHTAVSPCGRWLASGGAGGSAFLFDIGAGGSELECMEGIELRGQEGEVGAVDWADGAVATCADDGTVRVWRPDVERFRLCTENPTEAKWDWSWGRM